MGILAGSDTDTRTDDGRFINGEDKVKV